MANMLPSPAGLRAVRRTPEGIEVDDVIVITSGGRGPQCWVIAVDRLVPAQCDALITSRQDTPTAEQLDAFAARFNEDPTDPEDDGDDQETDPNE